MAGITPSANLVTEANDLQSLTMEHLQESLSKSRDKLRRYFFTALSLEATLNTENVKFEKLKEKIRLLKINMEKMSVITAQPNHGSPPEEPTRNICPKCSLQEPKDSAVSAETQTDDINPEQSTTEANLPPVITIIVDPPTDESIDVESFSRFTRSHYKFCRK
ncbi:uncharacterized protein LOC122503247 [Leptopilina heterotoma]|uniref:uncharacterized protein LOC122503247 n=1 Tax=Leptopilina heterotoma TaxID=63436 RepID=UPI001CA8F259|nr:uncharacterized protein LOC122503247 [Leptopilina heterotoma]